MFGEVDYFKWGFDFFTDATLVNINSLKFHQISEKCTENFSMEISNFFFNFERSFCACGLTDFTTGLIAATGFDVFCSELLVEFP